ncbi:hypothetical protein BGX27_006117, partial [Mortierella sp. AM989]
MATYKQRTPYNRHTGRNSPEQQSSASFSANTFNHTSSLSSGYPTDEILVDQEWTSIRQSASARARARQQLFLHQEQQRAQEWYFVLEQHQRPSLTTLGSASTLDQEEDISSDDYEDDISDVESPLVAMSLRGGKDVALKLRARTRASSIGQSSTISYSDLASESLEGLDELEDSSTWSQDDEDESTMMPSGNFIPASPSAISLSSTTSLSNSIHPSLAQSQMPFHDGSGNFINRLVASQRGSDHESDHGGWESSSSMSSTPGHHQNKEDRLSTRSQPYASVERFRLPISSSEFDSVVNSIALFQARYTPSSQNSPLEAREVYNRNNLKPHPPQIVTSSQRTRTSRPLKPSKLSTCSIYESEMEDIDAMEAVVSSKQGWLKTFESALGVIGSHDPELNVESSAFNNPIKALAQHYTIEDIDQAEDSKLCLIMPSKEHTTKQAISRGQPSSKAATETLIQSATGSSEFACTEKSNSCGNSNNNNAQTTDLKKIRQQVSASSLEALQSLQMRHRASCDVGQLDDRPKSPVRSSVVTASHLDPMQIHFSPTIMDGHSSVLDEGASLSSHNTNEHQEHSREYNSTLTVMVSALRRFRDHVKSNLQHLEFDEENTSNHLSGLGLECGRGFDWTTTIR